MASLSCSYWQPLAILKWTGKQSLFSFWKMSHESLLMIHNLWCQYLKKNFQYVGEGSEEFQDFLNLNLMISFLYDWMLGWFVSCVSGTLSMPFGTVWFLDFEPKTLIHQNLKSKNKIQWNELWWKILKIRNIKIWWVVQNTWSKVTDACAFSEV